MKKRIVVILVIVVIAAGGWWLVERVRARPSSDLILHGNVDIREVHLGFRVAGRLAEVAKDEGDVVNPGDILARLDDGPFRSELDEAEGRVESAQAHLALLQAGNRPQEIAQAKAVVREREVTFANAQTVYKRQEELLETRAVSQQERDDAEARFREAEARLKSAREQLSVLEAGFRVEEIAQARAELARAEAARSTAEIRVQDTILKAPSAGVVITRAQEPGAIVQASTTVLTVSMKEPVWVRAYISEPDLGRIHPGMDVLVYTDTAPGKPYPGKIGYISPRAEFTPKNVETSELRTSLVYRVRVVVEKPDEALRQGMPVSVRPATN
jgi:HlyD family secretion protein